MKFHFNIIFHLSNGHASCLFPSGLPTKTLYAPLLSPTRATRPAHLFDDYIFVLLLLA
jgi:hypothetical protein